MTHNLEERLAAIWPPEDWSPVTVIVAVSGGPDSMALLRSLLAVRQPGPGQLVAAHFNHRLRGADSDDDARFVREQAQAAGCPCVADQASDSGAAGASEESAREARYHFLRRIAKELGARYVATAHTADDQAETILHRIVRGTGLPGLAGIPPTRELLPGVALVRPLLTVSRADVLSYLEFVGQPFRQDATNTEPRFTRNRIRHELLPLLERHYNPRVRDSLIRLGQLADEAASVLAASAAELRERVVRTRPRLVEIHCPPLRGEARYLVCQMFMDVWREMNWGLGEMTQEHWQQLADLATAPVAVARCVTLPGDIRAVRDRQELVLTSASTTDTASETAE